MSTPNNYDELDFENLKEGQLFICRKNEEFITLLNISSIFIIKTPSANGHADGIFLDHIERTLTDADITLNLILDAVHYDSLYTNNDLINIVGEEAIFEYALSHDINPILQSLADHEGIPFLNIDTDT